MTGSTERSADRARRGPGRTYIIAGAAFLVAAVSAVAATTLLHEGPLPPLALVAVGLLGVAIVAGVSAPHLPLPPWRVGLGAVLSLVPYAMLHVALGPAGTDDLPLIALAWLALFGTRGQVVLAAAALGVQRLLLPVPDGVVVTAQDRVISCVLVVVAATVAWTVNMWSKDQQAERERLRESSDVLDQVAAATRAVRAGTAGRRELCAAAIQITGTRAALLFEPDGDVLRCTAEVGLHPDEPGTRTRLSTSPTESTVAAVMADGRRRFAADPRDLTTTSTTLVPSRGAGSALWEPVVHDGTTVAVLLLVWARRVEAAPERAVRAVSMMADELAALLHAEALRDSAVTDELTGLPNRRVWRQRAAHELAAAESAPEEDIVVALLDLDHFKTYNDRHGHASGDRLLVEFARRASAELRRGDVLIRWGGEEFVALLPGCRLTDAVRIVDRLRTAVPDGQTCSAGLARWDGREDADRLLARADRALYRAKERGRDQLTLDERDTTGRDEPVSPPRQARSA
ncbi:hypothetical protein GCM10027047_34540 [Rhodococcus aerolatus]